MRVVVALSMILAACGDVTAPALPDAAHDDAAGRGDADTTGDAAPVPPIWTAAAGTDPYAAFAVAADADSAVVLAALGGTGLDCAQSAHQPGCAIVRSTDDGATFAPVTADLDFVDARAVAISGAVGIAATRGAFGVSDSRLLLTDDAGLTWRVVSSSTDVGETHKAVAIDPAAPLAAYAADFRLGSVQPGDSFLIASSDGGRSWSHLRETAGNELRAYALVFSDDGTLFAGGTGTPGLAVSYDRGTSFTALGLTTQVYAVAVEPGSGDAVVYAGTRDDGVLRSIDGGLSFAPTGAGLSGAVNALVVDPDEPATIYAATDAGVFVSDNRGGSWSTFTDGMPPGLAVKALALTGMHALIAGTSSGVYRRVLP